MSGIAPGGFQGWGERGEGAEEKERRESRRVGGGDQRVVRK